MASSITGTGMVVEARGSSGWGSAARRAPGRRLDGRYVQVAFLALFLAYVLAVAEFTLAPLTMAAMVAATLLTQAAFVRALRIPDPGPLSPLISALSLCLLLRVNALWVAILAAVLAMASKFLLRFRGKHFFNPTNFGILAAILLTGRAWVSPSQWGSRGLLAFFLAALGLTVVRRVGRIDVSFAYLGAHAGFLLLRLLWLGERPEVLLHRLGSGALIVFAFFIISDPRSTPDARAARILFAVLTALLAHVLQFFYFIPSAPLWALLVTSPLTPLFDRLWPAPRFEWGERGVRHDPSASNAARPQPAV